MNDEIPDTPPTAEALSKPKGIGLWCWQWFWRVSAVAWIPVVWYCYYVPANNIAWAENVSVAQQQAAETGKPIVMFFTGKLCVPCRIMKRNVWADDQVATMVNASFIPVMIEMEDPEANDPRKQYQITGTPCTVVTDPQGKPMKQRYGGMSKESFLVMLGEFESPTREQPSN